MLPMNLTSMMIIEASGFMLIISLIYYEQMSNNKSPKLKIWKNEKENSQNKLFLSLFISFDPKTSTFIFSEVNWISMILPALLILSPLSKNPSRLMILTTNMNKEIQKQLEISLKSKKDGSTMVFICLFLFIVICNLLGLVPNFFTPTSHLTVNLFLALPLWSGFLIFGWYTYTNKMFAHLVPIGTPNMLISFMVLIEMISTLIRPLTLSIRLMANMVSGHLLMTLMGNSMVPYSIILIVLIVLIQTILFLLESGVALIQAYVFCMLMGLYSDESDYMT